MKNTIPKAERFGQLGTVAAAIHPEDLSVNDQVAVSLVSYQMLSATWNCLDANAFPPNQPVQVTFQSPEPGVPLRVKAICLPFVLCKQPDGEHQVLDVRSVELLKLSRDYVEAYRVLRRDEKRRKKKGRRKGRRCYD